MPACPHNPLFACPRLAPLLVPLLPLYYVSNRPSHYHVSSIRNDPRSGKRNLHGTVGFFVVRAVMMAVGAWMLLVATPARNNYADKSLPVPNGASTPKTEPWSCDAHS